MKFSLSALLAVTLTLFLTPSLLADFDATKWPSRRSILGTGFAGTAEIVPDRILYQGSKAALRDVRIVRNGIEVPYALETRRATSEQREVPASIRNLSFVSGAGVQFMLDAGRPARHNGIRIATQLHDFKQRVRVETSDDGTLWAIARNDGSIFDVSRADQPASSLSVQYPESTQRFVRVTIFGWRNPKSVNDAWLSRQEDRSENRVTIAEMLMPRQVEQVTTQTSEVTLDLGFPGMPHDKVVLDIAERAFSRSVEIDSGDTEKDWHYVGQGTIWRSTDGEFLIVPFSEAWGRYLRVRIFNHDDRPLIVKKISVQALTRSILFPVSAAGAYWIYYGNAGAYQPVYDLARTLANGSVAGAANLGPEEHNPNYREPDKPVSDRNPVLLYALLGVAIVVMGYVTVRFLMKVQA